MYIYIYQQRDIQLGVTISHYDHSFIAVNLIYYIHIYLHIYIYTYYIHAYIYIYIYNSIHQIMKMNIVIMKETTQYINSLLYQQNVT